MFYSSPHRVIDDEEATGQNGSRQRTYSTDSYDDTTLHDDDPVDRIERNTEIKRHSNKYSGEKNAINDAQSVKYTAYTMKNHNIVNELRNVGVTVLSLESLSTSGLIHYMDAVTSMRLGESNDEKCMLYTDRMGRVFNVVISGGAEGLAKNWSIVQASYSGWIAIAFIPFLIRVIASYPFTESPEAAFPMAMNPTMLLFVFGFILNNETSQSMLAMSIFVRGSNSVGSHVWRSGTLTDYPRLGLLTILTLASVATEKMQQALTFAGSLLGCLIIVCNLGSRAWKKIDINPIESSNMFTHLNQILASIIAGLAFPFMGLRAVDSGPDETDEKEHAEETIFDSSGKRGRQNIAVASTGAALIFLFSDVKQVQEALGFDFSSNKGIVNIVIGGWLFISSLTSMFLCRRLDASRSKKIQPFLRRDELSPVGWVVPSIPNIIIDPNLSGSKMIMPCLSVGSDILCVIIVGVLAFLIISIGVRDLHGINTSAFWEF